MRFVIVFCIIAVAWMLPNIASAQTRHALVVGIDDYVYLDPLQKARNDARAVTESLGAAGFRVETLIDADRRALLRGLADFTGRLSPGDEAVFYFAGHGLEVDGRNFLLPADIPDLRPGDEVMLGSEALPVDRVLGAIQDRGVRLSLLILDACRDNPFPRQGTRSLGTTRGLARLEPPAGTMIVFSAGTGQAALDRLSDDDPDPNSVFTRSLLPLLREPGLPLHQAARQLRLDVQRLAATVRHDQRPAVYDETTGDFILLAGVPAMSAPAAIVVDTPATSGMPAVPGSVFQECPDCPEMVVIPSGSFTMGSPSNEVGRFDNEGPRRNVRIARPFAMGVYEVTFAQWDACAAAGYCTRGVDDRGWGRGARPVINVSWDDVQAFVRWMNSQVDGNPYRLPSEAEWEYAARAGSDTAFWWGNRISPDQANYRGTTAYNNGPTGVYRKQTLPVGSFAANPFGLFDVHGNVWEWVQDCYVDSYAGGPTDGSARSSSGCSLRVLRGGSWGSNPRFLRSANRLRNGPDSRNWGIGFRLARTLTP